MSDPGRPRGAPFRSNCLESPIFCANARCIFVIIIIKRDNGFILDFYVELQPQEALMKATACFSMSSGLLSVQFWCLDEVYMYPS